MKVGENINDKFEIHPKISPQKGDRVSKVGKWTVIRSFSGEISVDELLRKIVTHYSKEIS